MELKDLIREYIHEQGISAREFGRRCGFSNAYVSTLLSGVNPRTKEPLAPQMETYKKVAKGMRVPLDVVLQKTGYIKGLVASNKDAYNPFFDEDNEAYGTDIEWRKRHGAIDDNPKMQVIVDLCRECDDATLDRIIAMIGVLK